MLLIPESMKYADIVYNLRRVAYLRLMCNLQALAEVGVPDFASVWRCTDGWASVAYATTLPEVCLCSTRCWGGGGASAAGRGGSANTSGKGRPDVTELDVGVDHLCVGVLGFHNWGSTAGGRASAASSTKAGRVGRVGAIEPEHVGEVIVPKREDEDHAVRHRFRDLGKSTLVLEAWGCVAERGRLLGAVLGVDRVGGGDTGDRSERVGDDDAVLDVEAVDLVESASGSATVGEELGDDGEFGVGVDNLSWAIEGSVAIAVRVEIATIGIADSVITAGASRTARGTGTYSEASS